MATAQRDQRHDLEFSVELDGQPPGSLRLTEFTWNEHLSSLYAGTATLASRNPDINLNDCIDRTVILTINDKYDAQPRYLTGIVDSITAIGFAGHWAKYQITIRPDLYRLNLTSDARIFQKTSVPDIVKKILTEHGIQNHEFRLDDTRPPREYCTQHGMGSCNHALSDLCAIARPDLDSDSRSPWTAARPTPSPLTSENNGRKPAGTVAGV